MGVKSLAADQPLNPKLLVFRLPHCQSLPSRNIDPVFPSKSSHHTERHAAFNQEAWHDPCTKTPLPYCPAAKQAPLSTLTSPNHGTGTAL